MRLPRPPTHGDGHFQLPITPAVITVNFLTPTPPAHTRAAHTNTPDLQSDMDSFEDTFVCPLSQEIMIDPVVDAEVSSRIHSNVPAG